jgi:hypothetical protein
MSVHHSDPGGDVAKKASKQQSGGDTLGGIAEGLGTLLGNAEKQWRAWQGPREAVVKAVSDVRDRAAALLSEMGAAAEAATGKKKDKKAKKGKKKDAAKAEKKQAAKAEKAEKKSKKDEKKAGKKKGKKAKATAAAPAAGAPVLP